MGAELPLSAALPVCQLPGNHWPGAEYRLSHRRHASDLRWRG